MNKAFFIDKDGTIVDNSKYPKIIPSDEILEDKVIEGLRYLEEKDYKLIIISNQPWISKGKMSKDEVEDIFKSLVKKLKDKGIKIEDYFYCPHKNEDECLCRKPKPGMILKAAEKHNIDLEKSFMIGDTDKDIIAGKEAGIKTILVETGHDKKFKSIVSPTYILKNLNEIARILG